MGDGRCEMADLSLNFRLLSSPICLPHPPSFFQETVASKIDGAGLSKLATLENAVTQVQRLNTVVERMAQSQRNGQPLAAYRQQIQRTATPIASLLKSQFEPICAMLTNVVLISGRGGSDQQKVRSLREAVAQIKVQLDAAESRVRKQHAIEDDKEDAPEAT